MSDCGCVICGSTEGIQAVPAEEVPLVETHASHVMLCDQRLAVVHPECNGHPRVRLSSSEPECLRRGRLFHKLVQASWHDAEGKLSVERAIRKPSGRRGRIDIHVLASDDLVAVVEVKATAWGAMTEAAVRRNVARQARQLWQYIDSQIADGKDVCPGVIFPQRPKDPQRLQLVVRLFEDQGIPVVWQDEVGA